MKVYTELIDNKNTALALGFFDGVHLAHQELIKKTVEIAKKKNLKSVLITFSKSPYSVIKNVETKIITPFQEKVKLIEKLGIDEVFVLDFNLFKEMDANNYVNDVLIKHFEPKFITTGFNHTFGKNKTGDGKLLSSFSSIFKYIQVQPVVVSNLLVSSTNIKKAIEEGEIDIANVMLNRNFSIKGKVVKGAQIARKLGYKTANLIWDNEIVKPKYGVYFGLVNYKSVSYQAMINFGIRPSIDKELKETLEVHILNFNQDIYDEEIEVEFYKKIRDEKKFDSFDELKKQIDMDYETFKTFPLL